MEKGIEQDYYEFEMILGEIPNMTSSNPYSEEGLSSPVSFNKFYNASQAGHLRSHAALYDCPSPGRSGIACLSSCHCPFDHKKANGNLDGGSICFENEGQSSTESTDGECFYLPDDKCLTSAFAQLSFTDGVPMETMNCSLILEGQQLNNLKKPLARLDSGSMTKMTSPQSPSTLNGNVVVDPLSNGLETLNVALVGEESSKFLKFDTQEPQKQRPWSRQSLEKLSGDLVEKRKFLPVQSGTVPLSPSVNPFHAVPGIHNPGTELSVGPYQRQCFLETHSDLPLMQPQHVCQSDIGRKHMEEEWYCKMPEQYLHLKHHWNQRPEPQHIIQANADVTIEPMTRNSTQPYFKIPISCQLEQTKKDLIYNDASVWSGVKPFEPSSVLCRYYSQGFCGRGKNCPFAHEQKQVPASSFGASPCFHENSEAVHVVNKVGKCSFPEKILMRQPWLNSPKTMKPAFAEASESCNHLSINGKMFLNDHFHHHSTLNAGVFQSDAQALQDFSTTFADLHINNLRLQPHKCHSLDDLIGRVYPMAKDQYGCRILQRKLAESNAEDIEKIFIEIIGHIVELMVDPFGNYLVQKLLEVCNENQRMRILHAITRKPGDLVRISLDGHGTRAVQKIIETISTPEHFSMVISSLKPGLLVLMKDSNGSHVVQRWLQYAMPQCRKFIFEAAVAHCVEFGTDRHGCCVLQKCLGHSDGEQRDHLVYKITSNALILSQDKFGNYVVQYVFELQIPWAAAVVLNQLEGNYESLSMQKYSSNVVERCLKYAEARCSQIVQELINSSQLDQILQHPYGNYVIQAALYHSKGASHAALVEAIRPHIPALRTSPYGKKVLSNKSLKK